MKWPIFLFFLFGCPHAWALTHAPPSEKGTTNRILEEEYIKRLDANPRDVNVVRELAHHYSRRNRFEAAINHLDRVFELKGSNSETVREYAYVLFREGQFSKAESLYKKMTLKNPNDTDARFNLGLIYLQGLKDRRRANFQFLEVVRINPNHALGHFALAEEYRARKKWSKARTHYEKVLRLDPGDEAAHFRLGQLDARQGAKARAAAHFAAFLKASKRKGFQWAALAPEAEEQFVRLGGSMDDLVQ